MPPAQRNTAAKRRSPVACTFCRRRKMKCNNHRPSCGNCDEYGKVCTYDELPKRPRPSNSRIASLEEENRGLRAAVQILQSKSPSQNPEDGAAQQSGDHQGRQYHEASTPTGSPRSPSASPPPAYGLDGDVPPPPPLTTTTSPPSVARPDRIPLLPVPIPSRTFVTAAGPGDGPDPHYHGPTSTLFDDTAAREAHAQQLSLHRRHDPDVSTTWIQKGLLAEAASQRHLETIHLAAGKLDFDGVDPDLGMHLLQLHWNRQHHSFLITYRPAFMRDMACGGPYFSRLLLNAIFFGASKFSNRLEVRRDPDDVRTAGWLFRERVRELLGGALDKSDITTIQALLVMTSSLFALGDERSAAWLYAGTAFRMIIDLGLHVDAAGMSNFRRLTDEDLEIRRRVFWGAFVVDKIQSLYQGRPVSLQEMDHSVPLTFHDEYEELENWRPFAYPVDGVTRDYPGSPAYSVSCFTQLCGLSLIMNRILNKVYAERSAKKGPDELAKDLKSLHADLQAWKAELPPHLVFDPSTKLPESDKGDAAAVVVTPPPHVLSLFAMYNVLLILLHRPFVSDGHLHANLRALAASSFLTCASAASAIVSLLRAYHAAFSIRRAPYLISYATYVAATIHVRIAAQPGGWGKEAKEALAVCLRVFEENQETNWAVRRARAVVGGLMKKMGVTVDLDHQESHDGQRSADRRLPGRDEAVDVRRNQHLPNSGVVQGSEDASTDGDAPESQSPSASSANIPGEGPAADGTTFDIDAIISSFMSSEQGPQAAAFQTVIPATTPQYHHPYSYNYPRTGHQYRHHQPYSASPPASSSAGNTNAPSYSWFLGGPAMPPTPSSSSYGMAPPSLAPPPPPPLPPLSPSEAMTRQPGRYAFFAGNGMGPGEDGQQDWQVRMASGEGGPASGPGGYADVNADMNMSDMLFGFNSSAVEGIGWEFEGTGTR